MRILLWSIIIVTTIPFLSCKSDDCLNCPSGANFSLKLKVKNSFGQPVSNLRVHGGGLSSVTNFEMLGVQGFATDVYKVRLIALDSAQTTTLFQSSIFVVLMDVGENPLSFLGFTSDSGTLFTDTVRRFAGALSLPPITQTNQEGTDSIGTFTISDTAIFFIRDTLTNQLQIVRRVIKDGANVVDVVWNPVSSTAKTEMRKQAEETKVVSSSVIRFNVASRSRIKLLLLEPNDRLSSVLIDEELNPGLYAYDWSFNRGEIPLSKQINPALKINGGLVEWKLYQNYPNPFN